MKTRISLLACGRRVLTFLFGVLLASLTLSSYAQSSRNRGEATKRVVWYEVKTPPLWETHEVKKGEALSAGVFCPSPFSCASILKAATPSSRDILLAGIAFPGTPSVGLVFNNFFIPQGVELYIYPPDYSDVRGPFTWKDMTSGDFFLPPFHSDSLVFEVNGAVEKCSLLNLSLSEVLVMRNPLYGKLKSGFGHAEDCEINVNCSEGDAWEMQKKAVVRILLRKGDQAYWCTGSLVNNTREDYYPYLLTADHCGRGASEYDLSQWVFYFNYAFPQCDNGEEEPAHQTMVGCRHVASSNDPSYRGSDFYLVELLQSVPPSYDPFFCGWDRSPEGMMTGVTIHHPAGDVKKIATCHEQVVSSDWDGNGAFHYWRVVWGETAHGHAVTEGGSSGAPLLNPEGNLVGTLTGGFAACEEGLYGYGTGPDEPDFFGKFSYSWKGNGTTPSRQLAPWLDPLDMDPEVLPGLYNAQIPVAQFSAPRSVVIGNTLHFMDRSPGNVLRWEWLFEGGTPHTSTLQSPPEIRYEALGSYDVRLIVSNDTWSDTLLKRDYVTVISDLYPVPASDRLHVWLGKDFSSDVTFRGFNGARQRVALQAQQRSPSHYVVDVLPLPQGIYYLEITSDQHVEMRKFMVLR